ncbi:LysR family transcriptional regulator [Nocardia vaccinii]|uniref:LysR family transcriptional regulator n=1 Tax=Nocardia vaccinii TaxID=1822 RepID=UPI000A60A8D7|nr:LysR family transcriptional regulator [Nocardia vaccinii]
MGDFDLNLLVTLDALLSEGTVTAAAERLRLSVPATSRALGRLRRALGDPLLVRAGRGMVPTPLASALAPQVRALLAEVRGLVDASRAADLARVQRTMTIRCGDTWTAVLGPDLLDAARRTAPGITLRFTDEGEETVQALRNGSVDLDVGVLRITAPEIVVEELYQEPFVAVVAPDHPLAAESGPVPLTRLCDFPHVTGTRRGRTHGPLDAALAEAGTPRQIAAEVSSFTAIAFLIFSTDTVGFLGLGFARRAATTMGLDILNVAADLPPLVISAAWHPRQAVDPAHRWLRTSVRTAIQNHYADI